jgi:hypothetical protein
MQLETMAHQQGAYALAAIARIDKHGFHMPPDASWRS